MHIRYNLYCCHLTNLSEITAGVLHSFNEEKGASMVDRKGVENIIIK